VRRHAREELIRLLHDATDDGKAGRLTANARPRSGGPGRLEPPQSNRGRRLLIKQASRAAEGNEKRKLFTLRALT
jgi:hypothetical protein